MRVVGFIPFGRQRTVSILFPYLHRAHLAGQLDEVMLCMNTDPHQELDRAYGYNLAKQQSSWVKVYERPEGKILHPKQLNTGRFYRYMVEPDSVYVRFDDDIVFVDEGAIPRLVASAYERHEVLASFPIIWNNAVCSWYLQQLNRIPREWGIIQAPYCMDSLAWANPHFAENMHNLLLSRIADSDVKSLFMHMDIQLAPRQQFSVSCFAVSGRDYAALDPPGHLDFPEEENWLTVHRPTLTGQVNVLVADALVSHFSFYPQHDYLFNHTNLYERYKTLSEAVTASL